MESKFNICIENITDNNILICPLCHEKLSINEHELKCLNNHNFTISKKGALFLNVSSNYKNSLIYNSKLFLNRRNFLNKNYYAKIYDVIANFINSLDKDKINILDLGSGEGTHVQKILERVNKNWNLISVDYSKDAINLVTDYMNNNICIVGDINNLPIKDKCIDIIIDFLSPYNGHEVKRILNDDGVIIKIAPSVHYLDELRNVLDLDDYSKREDIKYNFLKYFDIIDEMEVNNTYDITSEDCNHLIMMSPLKDEYKKKDICINKITINNMIYIGRCKNEEK